jgi:hypothetical protein
VKICGNWKRRSIANEIVGDGGIAPDIAERLIWWGILKWAGANIALKRIWLTFGVKRPGRQMNETNEVQRKLFVYEGLESFGHCEGCSMSAGLSSI